MTTIKQNDFGGWPVGNPIRRDWATYSPYVWYSNPLVEWSRPVVHIDPSGVYRVLTLRARASITLQKLRNRLAWKWGMYMRSRRLRAPKQYR